MSQMILPKSVDSKFRFITVAAQRAKQLQAGPSRGSTPAAEAHPDRGRGDDRGDDLLGDREDAGRTDEGRRRSSPVPVVVLGVTGCIGAYKACEVLRELQRREVDVHVVMTAAATRFVTPLTFEALSRHPVFHDPWELGRDGDIRHISIADEADLLLVAPATANILGKFARGIADDPSDPVHGDARAGRSWRRR